MQKQLKRDLKNKPLNTKSTQKGGWMKLAKSLSTAFSNKYKNMSDEQFTHWLEK